MHVCVYLSVHLCVCLFERCCFSRSVRSRCFFVSIPMFWLASPEPVCVCVFLCACLCGCVSVRLCVQTSVCVYIDVCVYVCLCVCVCVRACIYGVGFFMYASVCFCVFVCLCLCVCVSAVLCVSACPPTVVLNDGAPSSSPVWETLICEQIPQCLPTAAQPSIPPKPPSAPPSPLLASQRAAGCCLHTQAHANT